MALLEPSEKNTKYDIWCEDKNNKSILVRGIYFSPRHHIFVTWWGWQRGPRARYCTASPRRGDPSQSGSCPPSNNKDIFIVKPQSSSPKRIRLTIKCNEGLQGVITYYAKTFLKTLPICIWLIFALFQFLQIKVKRELIICPPYPSASRRGCSGEGVSPSLAFLATQQSFAFSSFDFDADSMHFYKSSCPHKLIQSPQSPQKSSCEPKNNPLQDLFDQNKDNRLSFDQSTRLLQQGKWRPNMVLSIAHNNVECNKKINKENNQSHPAPVGLGTEKWIPPDTSKSIQKLI